VALLAAIYSAAALIGALAGGADPLRPLAPLTASVQNQRISDGDFFTQVDNQSAINTRLARAKTLNRPAIIELYADWCISCKVIERQVLSNDRVRQELEGFERIKLDVTDNTPDQRQWLTDKGLFGPPAFLFFSAEGAELENLRIQGEIDLEGFMQRVSEIVIE
jgi:thiol:disulfide interchange protein DsbD